MKTYLLYLLIPIALLLFSQTPVQYKKKAIYESMEKYNIDSLKRENDIIKEQITTDIKTFKTQVDSVNKITEVYIKDLKNIKIDTTFVPVDTLDKDTVKKKKGWIRRTIDKIRN